MLLAVKSGRDEASASPVHSSPGTRLLRRCECERCRFSEQAVDFCAESEGKNR